VSPLSILRSIEEVGVPDDGQLRVLQLEQATELIQPFAFQLVLVLEPPKIGTRWRKVVARPRPRHVARWCSQCGWVERVDQLFADPRNPVPHEVTAYHSFSKAQLIRLIDHAPAWRELRLASRKERS